MIESQQVSIAATVLAAAAMWLMLPRGRVTGLVRATGALLGVVALGLWASQIHWLGHWVDQSVFLTFSGVTVAAAAAAVTFRNPIYCAIWFGMSLLGTAALLLLIGAQFLGVATIVVYAGAILVTFLFVLMLAQPDGSAGYDRVSWEPLISAATGMVIVGILSMTVGGVLSAPEQSGSPLAVASTHDLARGVLAPQHVAQIGAELFGRHLIAVEVAGVLLTVALIGAAAIVIQAKTPPTREPKKPETIGRTHETHQS